MKKLKGLAGYEERRKSLLTLFLLAGLVLKICYSMEMPSFAQSGSAQNSSSQGSFGVEAYDTFPESIGMADPVPGYREYAAAFAAVYPKQEIRVGVEDCVGDERNADAAVGYSRCADGIYTKEGSLVEFCVPVEEEGFYDLALEYLPLAGSDAAIECSILIDGEVPCRELERVCYDRIRTLEGGCSLTEQDGWITGVTYDRERRIAEPLSVYLTEGTHTVAVLSRKEPMLLHQIIFSPGKQVREYRQVKGFWDAVGIRDAGGKTITIEARQAVRASGQMEDPVQEEAAMSVMPVRLQACAKEAKCSAVGGSSWNRAGDWFEWEFDVEEAGYYHISLYDRQNYARGTSAYRKIMLDDAVPFREMERYGFAYRWGWREEMLSDDAGTPYVFYLKEGRHTLRVEAVPGETDPGACRADAVQPLAIDRIWIVPAGR